jgi:GH18 family chitinase
MKAKILVVLCCMFLAFGAEAQYSFPACWAPWTPSTTGGYAGGTKFSHKNANYESLFFSNAEPGTNGDWKMISKCGEGGLGPDYSGPQRIIGYLPYWVPDFDFKTFDPATVNHINIAFNLFKQNNNNYSSSNFASIAWEPFHNNKVDSILFDNGVLNRAHQKGVTVSVAIGGATDFAFLWLLSQYYNNDAKLEEMANLISNYVTQKGIDGVDLDLECWWPDAAISGTTEQGGRVRGDKFGGPDQGPHPACVGLTKLSQKLRQKMPNKLITAAVFGTSYYGNNYDDAMAQYMDWIGLMTYDFTGSWNTSPIGPHAALHKVPLDTYIGQNLNNPIYSAQDALEYWMGFAPPAWNHAGGFKVPKAKLCIGVPFYGYDLANRKPNNANGFMAPKWKEIVAEFPNAANSFDDKDPRQLGGHVTGNGKNIYYETPKGAGEKIKYTKAFGHQGVIIWELTGDMPYTNSNSMLKAINDAAGIIVNPSVPAAPTGLTATAASATQINLSWSDNSNNESLFRIERSPNGTSGWTSVGTASANVTTFNNTGLTASTTYHYRVRAENTNGNSGYSNAVSATTQTTGTIPAAPSGLTATAASSSQIDLSWADNSTNETGFRIERSLNAGTTWELVTTTSANVITFANTGLSSGTTYHYRVRAENATGNSAFSNTANATTQTTGTIPAAPSGLTATAASSSQIDLSWTDNSTNETGFRIERSLNAGTTWTLLTTTAANATTFPNTGLSAGTTYHYRVRAENATGNSAFSNTANATTQTTGTIPAAPSGLTATAASSSQIDLSWTDNSTNETGFRIERSLNAGTTWTLLTTTAANATSFSNTGLSESTAYHYRVRAENATGNSAFSNTANATTQSVGTSVNLALNKPVVVTSSETADFSGAKAVDGSATTRWSTTFSDNQSITVDLASSSSITKIVLKWEAAYGKSYRIETSSDGTNFTTLVTQTNSDGGVDEYPVTATARYVRMQGVTRATQWGYSLWEFEVWGTQGTVTTPAAPGNLTASATSSSQINLSWTDNSTNETTFRIERAPNGSTNWASIATVNSNITTYSNTGLSASTTYQYRVRAENTSGNSGYSNTASATTQSIGTVPSAPSGLVATVVSSSQINLSWTDNSSNETGFRILRSINNGSVETPFEVGANVTTFSSTGLTGATIYTYRVVAFNASGQSASSNSVNATTQGTDGGCSGVAVYVENGGYSAGSIVQNAGGKYQCKPWPFSGWCNGAAWAFGPGVGQHWEDAWVSLGSCTSGARESQSVDLSVENTPDGLDFYPNPGLSGTEHSVGFTFEANPGPVKVNIQDMNGAQLSNQQYKKVKDKLDVPVPALAPGLYLIKVQGEKKTWVKKYQIN